MAQHQKDLNYPGVYLWIWWGNPDRPMYVGKTDRTGWQRIQEHVNLREAGGYTQYDPPDGVDFWCWFAVNCHDPARVLVGAVDRRSITEDHRKLAEKSRGKLTFAFARVDGLNPETVEVQLRYDLDLRFADVIGWNPNRRYPTRSGSGPRCQFALMIFGEGAREDKGLVLQHQGSATVAQLFDDRRRCPCPVHS